MRLLLTSCLLALLTLPTLLPAAAPVAAPQPLYRDPVFDGAADPVVVWNPSTETWWMFYTNRRANVPELSGVAWVHGTRVSIAESADRGITWQRVGDAQIDLPVEIGGEEPTHWAPDVLTGPDGTHHMYLTVVPGVFEDWRHPRRIVHLTSDDLLHWDYQSALELTSDRVIDAGVARLPNGTWRMWYNNERDGKSIYYADSPDLYHWTDQGKASGVGERPGEGPYIFRWRDSWWMLVDLWRGLGVYRSDDLLHWEAQDSNLLNVPGKGLDDGVNGGHPGVVVSGDRAYLFYFTHPGRAGTITPDDGNELDRRRSSIQVTELELTDDGWLTCDRDAPTFIDLIPPQPLASTTPNRTLVSPAAFAGSSVNTPPGFNQSLVSNDTHQFVGFYRADGELVIARRALGTTEWTLHPTAFHAAVANAHNSIALGLDGAGALHLAWGHHNIPLQYSHTAPGGALTAAITFPAPASMIGANEASVTYPQFLTLPNGDLLFTHRDGGSGRGSFVLNRWSPASGEWTRLHDNLLDGENQRSAYPSFFTDRHGALHLAWTWRETPDVATNHDLAYARSVDGGLTWTDADGRALALPFNVATPATIQRIPPGSNLMNPPLVAADDAGNPLVANYWSPLPDSAPQYFLLRHAQGQWTRHQLTQNTQSFTLAGQGTKRPLFSRAALVADASRVSVAFRHDALGRAPIVIATTDITATPPAWQTSLLSTQDLGAWEPTADAIAASQHGTLSILAQALHQRDGNDEHAIASAPSPLAVLDLAL
ncbi:BNR-4 repeat-containing protein [Actomonas aquatica]|uniref:BNR-4 repeat-containing protein n=1 Tax=Actomonas aquatica TaxID=2866162 RepID=A0ABZ1C8A2_9BACT|nr:BNR-4 repeat-containing protein [Opitutus sp. WL0086]WRQ87662.1 BNR-4 repeat-containing protein [Opitutus sp. WL0086]